MSVTVSAEAWTQLIDLLCKEERLPPLPQELRTVMAGVLYLCAGNVRCVPRCPRSRILCL